MRAGASKAKAVAGRRPKAGAAPGELPRGPGSKLVHELGGTLATIGLHLRMASGSPLPPVSAQHLDAAGQALRASRDQLAQLAEILLRVERP